MSNGEELGDPDCTWAEDETPVYLPPPKGHPGKRIIRFQTLFRYLKVKVKLKVSNITLSDVTTPYSKCMSAIKTWLPE